MDLFNIWGQPWWEVYLSTFVFIIASLAIGFLALTIIALMVDKSKERGYKSWR